MIHRLAVAFCDNSCSWACARRGWVLLLPPGSQERGRAYGIRTPVLYNRDHVVVAGRCRARGRRSWMKAMVTG
jgi:hypothetical protein